LFSNYEGPWQVFLEHTYGFMVGASV